MRLYLSSFIKITSLLKQNRFIVLIVIFILSILEFLSISSLIPLIYALFNPNDLNNFLISNFNIQINMDIKIFMLIFVFFIFSLRFILTSLFIYFLFSYNRKLKSEISFKILNYSLKSTDNFINKNISTFQKQINMNVDYVVDIFVIPIFNLLSELLIICLLFMLSFLIIGKNIFLPAIILTTISYFYIKLLSKKQNYYSNQISRFTSGCNNELKKIFDLSSELIFKKKSNFFTNNFMIAREGLNKAIMIFQIINRMSIVLIEFIIFIIIIFILAINFSNDIIETIIKLSAITAISFRLIPSFSRCNIALNQIKFSKPFIIETTEILDKISDKKSYKKIPLQLMRFENVTFKYEKNKKIFKYNLSINLNKNTIIKGKNGSGKSTLLKIIFGINEPLEGEIYLIDKNKKKQLLDRYSINQNITYIHQNSKIFEGSLYNNISLDNKNRINNNLMKKALKVSTLDTLDLSQFEKIEEEGKNISGGESQKILIARAIYSNPKLIIFDETFSSIDKKSILKIINNLKLYKIKFFVISHNKNIPDNYFDQIIKLN